MSVSRYRRRLYGAGDVARQAGGGRKFPTILKMHAGTGRCVRCANRGSPGYT